MTHCIINRHILNKEQRRKDEQARHRSDGKTSRQFRRSFSSPLDALPPTKTPPKGSAPEGIKKAPGDWPGVIYFLEPVAIGLDWSN